MTQTENNHSTTSEDNTHLTQRIKEHNHLELKTVERTDHNSEDLEYEIDSDNNVYSSIKNNCCYFTTKQFNRCINKDGKFVILFNSRSLHVNFNHIKEYLQQFSQSFSIIAISETWRNIDKWMNFELESNEPRNMSRGGGGVALYVDKNRKFRVLESMTTVVNNVLECVTIEICKEKRKM